MLSPTHRSSLQRVILMLAFHLTVDQDSLLISMLIPFTTLLLFCLLADKAAFATFICNSTQKIS